MSVWFDPVRGHASVTEDEAALVFTDRSDGLLDATTRGGRVELTAEDARDLGVALTEWAQRNGKP